jgi:undecaprenyl-diphosphatase
VPVIAVGSISLNLLTKFFFHRERPLIKHLVEASGLSFPSGHSMVSASFYGLLIYLSWHNIENRVLHYVISGLLILTILLIGCSRVYVHVHYATDVMAGFSAGFLWVILGVYGLRRLERYSKRNLDAVVEEAAVKVE